MTENPAPQPPGADPPPADPPRSTKPAAAGPPGTAPATARRPEPRLSSAGGTGLTATPEYRFAVHALRGLREELVDDATAYRPLPLAGTRTTRWLPKRLRGRTAPHVVVAGLALLVLMIGYFDGSTPTDTGIGALDGVLPAAVVLLTLVRPVAAFWASLAVDTLVAVVAAGWSTPDLPWPAGCFAGHLVVLVVVALRTGPRATAWMWALTAAWGIACSTLLAGRGPSDLVAMLFLSALALLCVLVRHTRRAAQQEVTAERHVSAAERSRRTLLEERTTIARELHDVVAHHMSVVAIQAEAAPYRVQDPPPELAQAFATIRENAVAALTELRRLLGVVRAEDQQAPDAPQPTLADLDALLANVRAAGLTVTKTVTGAVRELPPGVELSAYRIVQEALSNVLRHAPGGTARVEVGHVLGGLGLRVVNDPPTGPARPSPGAGHGITGMRERVTMLDGEMTAGPTADGGYEVVAFLPVAKEPATGPGRPATAEPAASGPAHRGAGSTQRKGEPA